MVVVLCCRNQLRESGIDRLQVEALSAKGISRLCIVFGVPVGG